MRAMAATYLRDPGVAQFVWMKTADEILETLAAYYERIDASGHLCRIKMFTARSGRSSGDRRSGPLPLTEYIPGQKSQLLTGTGGSHLQVVKGTDQRYRRSGRSNKQPGRGRRYLIRD